MTTPTQTSRLQQPSAMRAIGMRTVTVLVLLATLELGLYHLGGFGHWTVTEQSERYGWRMLPDQDAWSRDLAVAEHINAAGFRDRGWDPAPTDAPTEASGATLKDALLYRVAVVGNSMSYGTSVPVEQTYPRVLEALIGEALAARGDDRRALVMNFSVQGYVFEQMARVYEDKIAPYAPDLLLVPVHPHDITPMGPSADDATYDFRDLVLRSATHDMLTRHVIDRWIPPVPPADRSKGARWAALDHALSQRPFARDHFPYWDRMLLRLDGLLETQRAHGGRVVVMTLPRWRKLFQPRLLDASMKLAPWARQRPDVLDVDPVPAFTAPMASVVEEVLARGLDAALTSDLSTITYTDEQGVEHPGNELDSAEQSLFLLDDVGHYTARGHQVLARVLFAKLDEAGWLD